MNLNNLLASPTFAGWLEGQALDIKSLLYTHQGKPRLSIISIAHLSDSERMFFVTIFLNELLAWMRSQPGTSSLRALFYMDEVFGYFPPSAKPPSKPPMLVLLKQARAFGLGIALATQNPVDLDYKGLSNIGTWFLGRLQTQRDKERVLEGLEGAAAQTGTTFNRSAMEQTLAALGSRVFLMNNVHDDGPTIFQTRWALSYLRGPLSRQQIQILMDPRRSELTPPGSTSNSNSNDEQAGANNHSQVSSKSSAQGTRPLVPNEIEERFWLPSRIAAPGNRLVYWPGILANVSIHYVRASAGLDSWLDKSLLMLVNQELPDDIWSSSRELAPRSLELALEPDVEYSFANIPAEMLNAKQFKRWDQDLRDFLYRHAPLRLFQCIEFKAFSQPGQDESQARTSWSQQVREQRDAAKESLQAKYATKLRALESKIRTASQKLEREKVQYDKEKWSTVLNFGQTVLGALLGNKISARSSSAGRSLGRANQERTDVLQASQTLEELQAEKYDLEQACEEEVRELGEKFRVDSLTLEPIDIPCRKGDLKVKLLAVLWTPWQIDPTGVRSPLVELPA
jgi:hypothetical protein